MKNLWEKGEKVKIIGGWDVWWEEKDGKKVVMLDGVEVDCVVNQVVNGEVVSELFFFEMQLYCVELIYMIVDFEGCVELCLMMDGVLQMVQVLGI